MAEDQGTESTTSQAPPGDNEQQTRLPKIALKTPPKREDIPSLQSTVLLMKHEFSSRQRQRLASDKGYQAIEVRAETQVGTDELSQTTRLCTCPHRSSPLSPSSPLSRPRTPFLLVPLFANLLRV